MPGWYGNIRRHLEQGAITAVGVVQEQHPARTLLFNQWKQLRMHVFADPLNRLEVSAVPIVLLVDRHGVIRYKNPQPKDVDTFLKHDYEKPASNPATERSKSKSELDSADRLAMSHELDAAIDKYRTILQADEDNAIAHFRLGVVLRMRYDSQASRPGDFGAAVEHWQRALQLDPNQYIWRRRIQQYGPVLDKPYPFYNWVSEARRDIVERGGEPVALEIEPRGAELASPKSTSEENATPTQPMTEPDPDGLVVRDLVAIRLEPNLVPSTDSKQASSRLHLSFVPTGTVHWNNEAEPLTVVLNLPEGVTAERRILYSSLPKSATSSERREIDVEISWAANRAKSARIRGYAVYHLCDKLTGVCTYKRQDFELPVPQPETR